MSDPIFTPPADSERLIDLIKDGGRRVMYGGDPYEDDVERDLPPAGTSEQSRAGP